MIFAVLARHRKANALAYATYKTLSGRTAFTVKSRMAYNKEACTNYNTPSTLVGSWYNELGSIMEIFGITEEGVLQGRYNSKVGDASCWYTLRGTYDKDGTESGGTIGWSVTYNNAERGNSKSTATWSGQRQLTPNGALIIYTTWLLTSQTAPPNNWESTLTNQDFFQKIFPANEEIRALLIARNFKEDM